MGRPRKDIELTVAVINDATRNEYPSNKFMLGDKEFEVRDLEYDDYLRFLELVAPLLEVLFSTAATPNTTFDIKTFVSVSGRNLPKMTELMVHSQDPEMTEDAIKKIVKSPYKLAEIVVKQIVQNRIIEDFVSFFGQILPWVQKIAG